MSEGILYGSGIGVRSAEELNGLDEDRLSKSIGAETAALLRPKKGDGVMFHKKGRDD